MRRKSSAGRVLCRPILNALLSLWQTQSGWRLIENWAMLLADVGFV
jgi:hypothetical protein